MLGHSRRVGRWTSLHALIAARDIRGQNSCLPPALRARCSRRTPKLVETEWSISELWADVRLWPGPKRVTSGRSPPEHNESVLSRTAVVRAISREVRVGPMVSKKSAFCCDHSRATFEKGQPGVCSGVIFKSLTQRTRSVARRVDREIEARGFSGFVRLPRDEIRHAHRRALGAACVRNHGGS
jgi:hypothetical protein